MSRLSRSKRKEIFRSSMKVARWIQRIENVQLPHGMFWNKFSHSSVGRRVGRGREVVVQSNRPLLAILWPLTPESRPMPKGGCNKGWHSLTSGTKDGHATPSKCQEVPLCLAETLSSEAYIINDIVIVKRMHSRATIRNLQNFYFNKKTKISI